MKQTEIDKLNKRIRDLELKIIFLEGQIDGYIKYQNLLNHKPQRLK